MPASRLGRLQHDLLEAFFRREQRFFLTGGAALAGFHLGHRETEDLDLFATQDVLDDGARVLAEAVRELGATLESITTAPDFRRHLVRRGDEAVVIDFVRERVPQIREDKPVLHGIRVDPPEEIFANKLCALLSRAEVRDLVDVRALEGAGLDLEEGLQAARRKDASVTPAQLAWVLSEIRVPPEATVPGEVSAPELADFVRDLVARLGRIAFPKP